MTTLDHEKLIAKLRRLSTIEFGGAAAQMAVEAMREAADALSSLPAQAVGVTDVMIDAAGRFRWGPDWSGKLDKEDWEDTRSLLLAALSASPPSQPAAVGERHGIYIASKTKHAARWRALRDQGVPVISTWIDEAGEGESQDLRDLWRRCLAEPAGAAALIVYREPDEVLKGGWIELGAAASHDVPVFAVGIRDFTISNHEGIRHFDTFDAALEAALRSTP